MGTPIIAFDTKGADDKETRALNSFVQKWLFSIGLSWFTSGPILTHLNSACITIRQTSTGRIAMFSAKNTPESFSSAGKVIHVKSLLIRYGVESYAELKRN